MKRNSGKMHLKKQVLAVLATSMMISNMILLCLLFYNFYVELSGVRIPIEGEMVEFHFTDHLAERLLIIGAGAALLSRGGGIVMASMVINRLLDPVNRLSSHMSSVGRDTIVENADLQTYSVETESLLSSFNTMTDSIREAFETQKNTSSYIAHELRTPLTVIQTRIDVYKKMKDSDPGDLVEMMEEQVEKLDLIINRILDFSDIQRKELNELVPVSILMEEVFDDLEEKAEEKNITMEMNMEDDIQDAEVVGCHDLMYQALYNMVENSIKYNREGGRVEVSLKEDDGAAVLLIKDTGTPVPEDEAVKIFRPYYRGRGVDTRRTKGNGIGLALTDKIIRHHDGRVRLIKARGDFSNTFEVVLKIYDGRGKI